MMNSLNSQRQEFLKRRWHHQQHHPNQIPSNFFINRSVIVNGMVNNAPSSVPSSRNPNSIRQSFPGLDDDDLLASAVPSVTVVLEGRSICQYISLHKHEGYHSLAKALRHMFVDDVDVDGESGKDLDLSDAIPGHIIAYEDMENDLLLVGDLNWKDFVRVAKRIRILPVKANSRRGRIVGA